MPNEAKKTLFQKINEWRTGRTDDSKGRLIGKHFNERRAGTLPIPIPKEFDPKLSARIFNSICRFWSNHWKWIIRTLIALGALIVAILGYLFITNQ